MSIRMTAAGQKVEESRIAAEREETAQRIARAKRVLSTSDLSREEAASIEQLSPLRAKAGLPPLKDQNADQFAVARYKFGAQVGRVADFDICMQCQLKLVIYCRRTIAIAQVSDLRGKKFRSPSPIGDTALRSAGAFPMNISFQEVPTALDAGLLDCVAVEEYR